MNKLQLFVSGEWCNSWPILNISLNNLTIFKDEVKKECNIDINLDSLSEKNNILHIGMEGKKMGEQNIYDTIVDDNGTIVKDKYISIHNICIDEVEISKLLTTYYVENLNHPHTIHDTHSIISYNGYYEIQYSLPLYDSLIQSKFNNNIKREHKSYFSDTSSVFEYSKQNKLIEELEKIINEQLSINN